MNRHYRNFLYWFLNDSFFRSDDVKFLSIMPNLPLLKCGGASVRFVCSDSVEDIHNKDFTCVLDGEQGILVPVSCDVILDNYGTYLIPAVR